MSHNVDCVKKGGGLHSKDALSLVNNNIKETGWPASKTVNTRTPQLRFDGLLQYCDQKHCGITHTMNNPLTYQ